MSVPSLNIFVKRIAIAISLSLSGCSFLVSSASEEFAANLKSVILNHNDPATVAAGIPAYLLMQEALIKQQPENQTLLIATASLYRSYANLIEPDEARLKALNTQAFALSTRAVCMQNSDFCQLQQRPFAEFDALIKASDADDLASLYNLGASWAAWVQVNKSDWNAVAQLAQVKALMRQVIKLEDGYQQGAPHVYLAILASLLPPAMGGEPDVAKQHFERAIELSKGKNLMVKVLYAKHYARLLFERELHDELLQNVMQSKVDQNDLTLINIAAQQQAQQLLNSADDYF